jgi:putative FmdB family regulatory protein
MPTYEYACAKCGEHLEAYQTFSEEPLKRHAECGGKLQKVFSPVGIVLKGSGFYKTDSRNASRAASKASESNSGSDSKSDTKTESKTDTTSEKKSDAKKSDSSSSSKKDTSRPAKKSA